MRFKSLLLRNSGLKIASLIFAIILWFFVISRGKSEVNFEVPLEFKNIPSTIELTGDIVKSIDVRVQGQEGVLRNLRSHQINAYVDLTGAKAGESTYYITQSNINVPMNVKVSKVSPSTIKVRLEKLLKKDIEVEAHIIGKPAPGFKIQGLEVTPSTVRIEGLKKEINSIKTLKTEPIDISGAKEGISQVVKVNTAGRNIRSLNKEEVKVNIKISKERR
ncbi:MAG: CdaR family protein [Nitrospirota bacterium]